MYTVLLVIHSVIVVFLIMMVLIQRTESDGMGGLGGGGGNQFLSGRTTANLMTRMTAMLAAAFMVSSLILAVMAGRMTQGSILDSVPVENAAPIVATKDAAKDASKDVNDTKPAATDKPAPMDKSMPVAPAVPKPE